MKKTLYSALWVLGGVVLFHLLTYLEWNCNLFSWHPTFDLETILSFFGIIAVEAFLLWLMRKNKTTSVFIVSLLVCIALTIFGVKEFTQFQSEVVSKGQGLGILVSRSTLSPVWYRIAFPMLYFIPLISLAYYKIKANQRLHSIANPSGDPVESASRSE